MSNMEFLDPQEAEKFKKQKCLMFSGTPCTSVIKDYSWGIICLVVSELSFISFESLEGEE